MKIFEGKKVFYSGDYCDITFEEDGTFYAVFTLYDEEVEGSLEDVLYMLGEWLDRAGYDYDQHEEKIKKLQRMLEEV